MKSTLIENLESLLSDIQNAKDEASCSIDSAAEACREAEMEISNVESAIDELSCTLSNLEEGDFEPSDEVKERIINEMREDIVAEVRDDIVREVVNEFSEKIKLAVLDALGVKIETIKLTPKDNGSAHTEVACE